MMHEPLSLDAAIAHAQEVAECKNGQCSSDHAQLASWLLELKQLRKKLGQEAA